MTTTIIYPGNHRQPCQAEYAIVPDRSGPILKVTIVVIQGVCDAWGGTILWSSDEARNNVLNRILEADLNGIRIEFIDFVSAHIERSQVHAVRFPIHCDLEDFAKRGGKHRRVDVPADDIKGAVLNVIGVGQKQTEAWSGDVVAGSCRTVTIFDEGRQLSPEEAAELVTAAGVTLPA